MSVEAPTGSGRLGDLRHRVLVAAPAVIVAIAAVAVGGAAFALFLAAVGAAAAVEASRLLARFDPATVVGSAAVAAMPLVALAGGAREALLVVLLVLPITALLARESAAGASASVAATALGVGWIGLPLALGVLLRKGPQGEELVFAVLIGTFVGDTGAHLLGAAVGRRPLAPRVSPRKTVEGLVAGVVVGAGSVWLFAMATGWLGGFEALAIGLAVSLAAPVGDLFESLLKRDAGVKDSGRLLGPHGGVLDRIDAVLFAVVAGYYASLALA